VNAPSLQPACANCGAAFVPERRPFCPECGQETRVQAPRVMEFVQQFGGAYLSTEGALWRTLKLLLFRPGELTRQYLAGRRKHYVLPLRLYLTISLLTLLLVRVLTASDVEIKPEAEKVITDSKPNLVINLVGNGRAGLKDGVFFCENLPQWVCGRMQRRLDVDPKAFLGQINVLKDRFVSNLGAAMFLLLPSFALWLKLLYLGSGRRYTEHLVFALHVHAFWFLALALMLSGVQLVIGLCMLGVPVYTLLAMRRVYVDRWWTRLLRAALVSTLYGVVMMVALVAVMLWTLLA
jgi:hypothetical protein